MSDANAEALAKAAEEEAARQEAAKLEKTGSETEEEIAAREAAEEEARLAEEEEHKEKSQLGRRVSAMETKQDEFLSRMDAFLETQRPKSQETIIQAPEVEEGDLVTAGDVRKLLQYESDKREADAKKYDDTYINTVKSATKDMSDEDVDAVVNLMQNKYNTRPTGNASQDASINFKDAQIELLTSRLEKGVNPLKGKHPKVPTKLAGGSTNPAEETTVPDLDPVAAAFIKESGMKDEDVIRALKRDDRPYLTK